MSFHLTGNIPFMNYACNRTDHCLYSCRSTLQPVPICNRTDHCLYSCRSTLQPVLSVTLSAQQVAVMWNQPATHVSSQSFFVPLH
jgi:hypothetical protein